MSVGLLRLISPGDPVAEFDCGVHALNDFLARHALHNSTRENSPGKTWLLHRADGDPSEFPEVLGFVTLSMSSVASDKVAPHLEGRLPRYPAPVALIGRLAVDLRAQGRMLGRVLLREALLHVVEAAAHLGCVGVMVDAKDERAHHFYERAGFVSLDDHGWPRPLFLPLATVKQLLGHGA
jgi:GNAT superfamily N-acetyltransferase